MRRGRGAGICSWPTGKGWREKGIGRARDISHDDKWRWMGDSACRDYDTHEADIVPRFGRRQIAEKSKRARGDLQRGPPR
jgi:hypothetical protein